jgi:hypothetical protein
MHDIFERVLLGLIMVVGLFMVSIDELPLE